MDKTTRNSFRDSDSKFQKKTRDRDSNITNITKQGDMYKRITSSSRATSGLVQRINYITLLFKAGLCQEEAHEPSSLPHSYSPG
jgi:hypothetical protein